LGRHEQPQQAPQAEPPRNFWGTFGLMLRLPKVFLLGLLILLIALAIVAVQVQNRYGDGWGAFVSALVAPLVCSMLLKARLDRRRRR
jgi:multisubunit Na+/H+ antiporter MnhG subunit